MTANNEASSACATCGQPLPVPCQEDETPCTSAQPEALDGFNSEYTELVRQLALSARVKLASRLQKAGIARDAVGDLVLLPLQAAVAAQVRRRSVAKASSAAKRLAAKDAKG